jgi:transcriptional regulator with GAF, ATPase, and Fis domain
MTICGKARLTFLLLKNLKRQNGQDPYIFLLPLAVACNLFIDVVNLVRLLRTNAPSLHIQIEFSLLLVRLSWVAYLMQYYCLGTFMERFVNKANSLKMWHRINFIICSIFSIIFIYFAVTEFHTIAFENRSLELQILGIATTLLYPSILCNLLMSLYRVNKSNLPKFLGKQIKIFITAFILPYLIFELLQFNPIWLLIQKVLPQNELFVSIYESLAFGIVMYLCMHYLFSLRFLNIQKKYSPQNGALENFNKTLIQLTQVRDKNELVNQTKLFFREHFKIALGRTSLYLRDTRLDEIKNIQALAISTRTENLLSDLSNIHNSLSYIFKRQIIIKDELEFDLFYEHKEIEFIILQYLHDIHAEIFIPIINEYSITGFIIIEEDIQNNHIYSDSEKDRIRAFASFLSTTLTLLESKDISSLRQREKLLHDELYQKHREIAQYKESIYSFMKKNAKRPLALIQYKNRIFTHLNLYAQQIIPFNINIQQGHLVSKELKKLCRQALEFRSEQIVKINIQNNETYLATAIPNYEGNTVLVILYPPELSDILVEQLNNTINPTNLDYQLYLETTNSGKLINQLLPGNTENILNFKIALLKIALNKKAVLLQVPHEDILDTVELIHSISMREQLHILKLQPNYNPEELYIKLFGINQLIEPNNEPSLFEKLNKGTLFIEHIHLLDLVSQEMIAVYLEEGFFKKFKSSQNESTDVRILCSSSQNLHELNHQGKFNSKLLNYLTEEILTFPSLLTLNQNELEVLTKDVAKNSFKNKETNIPIELTEKETHKIIAKKPVSIAELKYTINQLIINKNTPAITKEVHYDSTISIHDSKLAEASRLGKHALKDPYIMGYLWNKFKNQNKIATFLGVNRSSVNRRCKEFNLM